VTYPLPPPVRHHSYLLVSSSKLKDNFVPPHKSLASSSPISISVPTEEEEDGFMPWGARKTGILQKYTTNESIGISVVSFVKTSFLFVFFSCSLSLCDLLLSSPPLLLSLPLLPLFLDSSPSRVLFSSLRNS
jgi:hypothetical protein